MKNVNLNLNIDLTINVDGQKAGGFSSGLLPMVLAHAASSIRDIPAAEPAAEPAGDAGELGIGDGAEGNSALPGETLFDNRAPAEAEAAPNETASVQTIEPAAKQDHSDAKGAGGSNAAKLAWALDGRFFVSGDDELYEADDLDSDDEGVSRVVAENDPAATSFINLYREAEGYAKAGTRVFYSAAAARGKASSRNYIGVVGLVDR